MGLQGFDDWKNLSTDQRAEYRQKLKEKKIEALQMDLHIVENQLGYEKRKAMLENANGDINHLVYDENLQLTRYKNISEYTGKKYLR